MERKLKYRWRRRVSTVTSENVSVLSSFSQHCPRWAYLFSRSLVDPELCSDFRPHCCTKCGLSVCVCLLETSVNGVKIAEPIELWTREAQRTMY